MPELDFRSALETNWIKLGTLEMEATGSKLIVVQDEFRFGTECTACGAKDIRMISQTEQRSVVECKDCGGSGKVGKVGNELLKVRCQSCEGRGWKVCPECKGTGAEDGLIAHPQDRERRPTTGTVVSVGDQIECPDCKGVGSTPLEGSSIPEVCYRCAGRGGSKKFRRGDSVIYPSFAGDFFDLEAKDVSGNDVQVTIGILGENEIIARVRGHLELRRVKSRKALHTAA